jgi:predicted DNA-binding ribbon-helix-helix protein
MKPYPTYRRMARKGIAITRKSIHPSLHAVIRRIAEQRNCSVPFLLNEVVSGHLAKR